LITFLVTASGVSFFGIGAAFWGLALGVAADWLLFGELPRRREVPLPEET
jgi:benzoate membrane transport protein